MTSDSLGSEMYTDLGNTRVKEEEEELVGVGENTGAATDVWPPVANAARVTTSDRTTAVDARALGGRRDMLRSGCPPTTEGQSPYSFFLALALASALGWGLS